MGEYGFDRGNDAGIDATAQMPGADGYPGYSPGHGEGNPAPAKTMVTRRRAVVTAILCSMFAFGVSAAYAESSKGNAGDKALASRYEAAKNELSATKAENDELKRKLEAADGAKANAESEAGKLRSQVNALTSERNTCKSDLAAKNGSSALQPAQSQRWRADRRVECSLRHVIREGVIRPIRSVRPGGERRLGLFRARRPLPGRLRLLPQLRRGQGQGRHPHLPRAAGIPAQARPRRGTESPARGGDASSRWTFGLGLSPVAETLRHLAHLREELRAGLVVDQVDAPEVRPAAFADAELLDRLTEEDPPHAVLARYAVVEGRARRGRAWAGIPAALGRWG